MPVLSYCELQVATAFSFLRGAAQPKELVATAALLGHAAIGITDQNSVAGVVRAYDAARTCKLRLVVGARLSFRDGTPDLLCYPRDRAAWGRLTRLLTTGKMRGADANKRECLLDRADLDEYAQGQLLLIVPPARLDPNFLLHMRSLAAVHRGSVWLTASRRNRADDAARLRALADHAAAVRVRLVATNDVLYHEPSRRPLQDVLTCLRLSCTIEAAGRRLQANAERYLKPAAEMARLFRVHPEAIAEIGNILDQARFSLADLSYQYPDEPVPPGSTPDAHLRHLAVIGASERYPAGVPDTVWAAVEKELQVIAHLDYARYFLTVHDIVRYASSVNILCQGRGSAANSALCYCIGVTAVDPAESNLLFERFISSERKEPPDIDIDFEHERREEVIQYIYRRYGRHRAGIAATVIHFRPKLAIREVGKVMGLSEDATAALSAKSWNSGDQLWSDERVAEIGLDPYSEGMRRAIALARELVGLPRHLSQHVGGFVLTQDRLDETVPIGPAAMPDRSFIEWDKDDIDQLRIMKVDVLALGMLTCLHKGFDLLAQAGVRIDSLADIPREDRAVYDMLTRGDSLGVFQVESRAQMNMLPRLRPREFYDLVIEVAIVRPGPIQGDMVHPYLRRRQGLEEVTFASPAPEHGDKDELRRVLGRTLGVPLFQEQAMRIAIEAAKFTPEEANQLRRAMATFRHVGTIQDFEEKMVEGMVGRGYDRAFAMRCFEQIKGFGTYGFPESHAASFAHLVYVSAWLKCYHPAVFACALLNSQPMGFYAPAQIVRDAREHAVPVRAIDVGCSEWDCSVEGPTLRLGFRLITGFRAEWGTAIVTTRPCSFADLVRLRLPLPALQALADADALRSLGLDRRAALWQVRGLDDRYKLPLFDADIPVLAQAELPLMSPAEQVIADYQTVQLSLKAHPLSFLRAGLARAAVVTCAEAIGAPEAQRLRVAGVVLVRQRPGTASGVIFATIEDETGIANIVIWNTLQQRYRRAILGAALLLVQGRVQRSPEGVVHVIAETLEDHTVALRALSDSPGEPPLARADEIKRPHPPPHARAPTHPRNERPIAGAQPSRPAMPRSRDFH
jgi:error-prone DNA polymerase